jgi:hypothetical protein
LSSGGGKRRLLLISRVKRVVELLSSIAPHLVRLHVALFYFNGRYLEISKRLTSIRYVGNRAVLDDNDEPAPLVRPSYKLLGMLLVLRSLIELTNLIMSDLTKRRSLHPTNEDFTKKFAWFFVF